MSDYIPRPLTEALLQQFEDDFFKDEKNILAQNICSHMDLDNAALSRERLINSNHLFEHTVDEEVKPVTNQKSTGRCWIFAALNNMRIPFAKHYNLEGFEFSPSFLFFFDKLERCNSYLNNIWKITEAGEPLEGRLYSFFLSNPIGDGGQWDMFMNLLKKYGIVPKSVFPESYSSENSSRLNTILRSKLREYTKDIRKLVEEHSESTVIRDLIMKKMEEIYNIVAVCLGNPPSKFYWEYYDKQKNYHIMGPYTPLEFYNTIVEPITHLKDKVCLVSDPRESSEYNELYTIQYLGNVIEGEKILYNNQPIEFLLEKTAASLKDGQPVWFGCEVSTRFYSAQGIQDLKLHDYKLLLGTEVNLNLSKGERLMYGDSKMTHAMNFTGVSKCILSLRRGRKYFVLQVEHIENFLLLAPHMFSNLELWVVDHSEKAEDWKFRVENSWGEGSGNKGYIVMTGGWFKEFVFEIVIDKRYLPESILNVFEKEPIPLPPWDPMGTLAL